MTWLICDRCGRPGPATTMTNTLSGVEHVRCVPTNKKVGRHGRRTRQGSDVKGRSAA